MKKSKFSRYLPPGSIFYRKSEPDELFISLEHIFEYDSDEIRAARILPSAGSLIYRFGSGWMSNLVKV